MEKIVVQELPESLADHHVAPNLRWKQERKLIMIRVAKTRVGYFQKSCVMRMMEQKFELNI